MRHSFLVGRRRALCAAILMIEALAPRPLRAQDTTGVRVLGADSVSLRFVESDLRAVIAALGRYLPKPVLTANLPGVRVSLETPAPVSRSTVALLLRGLVESHGLTFQENTAYYQISPRQPGPATDGSPGRAAGGPVALHVIRLKHARAADITATINQLFGAGGEFAGPAGRATGTLSDELRRTASEPGERPMTRPGARSPGLPASVGGPLVVVPDVLTNSLLVRASDPDFEVVRTAVEQLDIRPLQVLIEVLIVEARHDSRFSLGADFLLPRQSIGGDQTVEGGWIGGGLGDLVIKLMNLGKADVDAVLRTAQARGDVEIVSRPVLLAANNTEASFLVGSQRPFVQVSRSLPTDTPTRDQVVQYKDVGTKLTVRPTINQDGYVSLFVQQEINAATSETQFDAPVISTREAVTEVLVRDSQTIMLGGLRDRQRDRASAGVPVLSAIPLIGGLFGGVDRRSSETELYLFLTPRIIRSDEDVDRLTRPHLPGRAPRGEVPRDSSPGSPAGGAG